VCLSVFECKFSIVLYCIVTPNKDVDDEHGCLYFIMTTICRMKPVHLSVDLNSFNSVDYKPEIGICRPEFWLSLKFRIQIIQNVPKPTPDWTFQVPISQAKIKHWRKVVGPIFMMAVCTISSKMFYFFQVLYDITNALLLLKTFYGRRSVWT